MFSISDCLLQTGYIEWYMYIGSHVTINQLLTTESCMLQVFHCLHHDGDGGQTLLVDGFQACEALRREDEQAFKLLCDTRIFHEYREPGVFTKSLDSVINVHPLTGELRRLRYNQYDR